jgi:hypothetical protein
MTYVVGNPGKKKIVGAKLVNGTTKYPPLDNWILCNTTTDIYMYKQFLKKTAQNDHILSQK